MNQELSKDFPIVGLGASAGGLEALEEFFERVPPNPGIAFVVITHALPDRKSLLPELLGPHCRMSIVVVREPTVVEPNHVYLTEGGESLRIQRGVLHPVTDRKIQRLPIDLFFRSLAMDQGERAVGIVLSGTGSDGTLGLEEIKGAGGMVMAQDRASARFPGMPQSAIQTQLVDYVLRAEELPAQLLAYVSLAVGPDGFQRPKTETPAAATALDEMFAILRSRSGHDFSEYKRTTILRRLERRMHINQVRDLREYVAVLKERPAELDVLFKELLIGVTAFFRDPEAFRVLADDVLPQMLGAKPDDYALRIWVPGCATGEEAYSLAILLREVMDKLKRHLSLQIFATDLDANAIEYARSGLYPASIADDVGPERLERFFAKEDDCYRIRKDIREKLIFAPQNLIEDPPFTKVDLLSCRNLLIYLEGKLQQRLFPVFHYALRPGGVLFLGSSETTGSFPHLFEVIDKKWKIFRRKDTIGASFVGDFSSSFSHDPTRAPPNVTPAKMDDPRIAKTVERMLLDELVPPSVLVHEHGDVVHIHGRTGLFLEPAPGPQTRINIFHMVRENLHIDLSSAIRKASTEQREVVNEGVRVKSNGHWMRCDLHVRPLLDPPPLRGLFLVSFERPRPIEAEPTALNPADESEARNAELGHEIQRLREYHQSAIEELETANEELKSTNEELQSTNEELQSSNEELETSKEEMQSLNEELHTVNAELEGKVEELSRTNDDMKNLLNSTDIATVFLDNDLHIKRYTDRARKVIRLIPSDVGRPIGDLVHQLEYDNLVADAREVLHTLVFREVEVKSRDGGWFLTRILPYRTAENVIDGIVITFVDIDKVKGLLADQRRMLRGLQASMTTVFVQNVELRYEWVSGPLLGVRPEVVLEKTDAELFSGQEASQLIELKKAALQQGTEMRKRLILRSLDPHEYDVSVEPERDEHGTIVGLVGSVTAR